MITIQRARAVQGKVYLPPSADLFLVASFASLSQKRPVRISPVDSCPAARRWAEILAGHAAIAWEENACAIDPRIDNQAEEIVFADDAVPYRELVIFLALATGKRVVFRSVSEKRLSAWSQQALRIGFQLEQVLVNDQKGLKLKGESSPGANISSINEQDINAALGLLFGLRAKRSFQIDFTLSTPLRHLCRSFGYEIAVKRDIGAIEKDPILRRAKIAAGQRLSSQDQLFSITADFSTVPGDETAAVALPGDEVLFALFLALKSLVHKGSLVIDNAPLEPWAAPLLSLMRKMGCRPSQQETGATGFGACGMVSIQKYELTGQKTDFAPQIHYASQLPAMAVLAAFAEGESVFRRFGDLRNSDPDGIRELEACLRTMGVKYGDIPDGFVIKGSGEYDGFDLIEPLPPHMAGAFSIAGLHCVGSTTINDGLLLERWPDFPELISKLCEFRT